MNKRHQNINLLVTVILGLLIFSHAVIPLDHHLPENNTSRHTKTPDKQNSGNAIHCYVLNNIIFQKINISVENYVKIQKNTGFNVFKNHEFSFIKFSAAEKKLLKGQCFNLPEYIFSKIEPARGSPSLFC